MNLGSLSKLDKEQAWNILEWVVPQELQDNFEYGEHIGKESF